MRRRVDPAVLAFALGFGVFIAFAGGAVVGPPDPFTQVLAAGILLPLVTPVVYWVLAADRVGDQSVRSRRPFPYLVAATTGSVLAAAVAPVGGGRTATLLRGGVFLAAFGAVSWIAATWWREGDTERPDADGDGAGG